MTAPALCFFGTTSVRLSGADRAVRSVMELWEPFAAEAGSAPVPTEDLTVQDAAVASAQLNRTAVASCPHPAVHAGVVALPGGAVAMPATSGAGKSTLVTALCLAGARYVSDEALVMGHDATALPYPKPVALSLLSLGAVGLEPTGPPGESPEGEREHLMPAARLGSVAMSAMPVGHLVLPTRGTEGRAALDPLPRREGLAALLELGFNHHRDPAGFLTAAATLVRGASVWRLRYEDARDAANLMADVLH